MLTLSPTAFNFFILPATASDFGNFHKHFMAVKTILLYKNLNMQYQKEEQTLVLF